MKGYRAIGMAPLLALLAQPMVAQAEEVARLLAKPGKCVTLKQGQRCHQDVTLHWQAAVAGDYCLYVEASEQPLHCWLQASRGEHRLGFASSESIHYRLQRRDQPQRLAEAMVEVKWVYRQRPARGFGWRVF